MTAQNKPQWIMKCPIAQDDNGLIFCSVYFNRKVDDVKHLHISNLIAYLQLTLEALEAGEKLEESKDEM